MADKIKMALGDAAGLFGPALAKLAQLNLHSGRDAYALMRTEDVLAPEVHSYRRAHLALLKRHGARGSLDELRAAVKQMRAPHPDPHPLAPPTPQGEDPAAELAQKIAALEPVEQFTLTPADTGYAAFVAEVQALAAQPVELFLDHRVPVRVTQLPDGYFSPAEMRALAPLVEFMVE